MPKKSREAAIMQVCPGVVNDGIAGHSMRDECYNCAPFWEQYPTCPIDKTPLTKTLYCKECKTIYAQGIPLDLSNHKGYGHVPIAGVE